MAIASFRDRDAELLAKTGRSKRYSAFERAALRKLRMLEAATALDDLRSPPGNHLEALLCDRAGQYSIRVNDQFRICFRWDVAGTHDVEIVDYH